MFCEGRPQRATMSVNSCRSRRVFDNVRALAERHRTPRAQRWGSGAMLAVSEGGALQVRGRHRSRVLMIGRASLRNVEKKRRTNACWDSTDFRLSYATAPWGSTGPDGMIQSHRQLAKTAPWTPNCRTGWSAKHVGSLKAGASGGVMKGRSMMSPGPDCPRRLAPQHGRRPESSSAIAPTPAGPAPLLRPA